MQLQDVSKTTYRKNLNVIIAGFIITLLCLSLAFGRLLIAGFSDLGYSADAGQNTELTNSVNDNDAQNVQPINQDLSQEPPSNFKYNFLGVFLALLACAAILHSLKTTKYFHEVYYVWQLKQIQNLIYRKLKTIKKASDADDETAILILKFYYQSLQQVYQLDDNTLTMSTIHKELNQIDELIAQKNLQVTTVRFDKSLLASYS